MVKNESFYYTYIQKEVVRKQNYFPTTHELHYRSDKTPAKSTDSLWQPSTLNSKMIPFSAYRISVSSFISSFRCR